MDRVDNPDGAAGFTQHLRLPTNPKEVRGEAGGFGKF